MNDATFGSRVIRGRLARQPGVWIVLCVLVGCGSAVVTPTMSPEPTSTPAPTAGGAPESHDISGAVVVNLNRRRDFVSMPFSPGNCEAGGRFVIFAVPAQVDVRDESGDIVAQTRLMPGEVIPEDVACSMPFELTDVPSSTVYEFWVAGRPLGTFSHAEMAEMNWTVVFQLGEPRGE